jgi:hypothetical protein
MIVEGYNDSEIIRKIRNQFGVGWNAAKKWLNIVYQNINRQAADATEFKPRDYMIAKERFEIALRIAIEKRDPKAIIQAATRLAELQGLFPKEGQGVVVNNNIVTGPVAVGSPDYAKLSDKELENIIEGEKVRPKALPAPQEEVIDIPEVLSAEQAAALMA